MRGTSGYTSAGRAGAASLGAGSSVIVASVNSSTLAIATCGAFAAASPVAAQQPIKIGVVHPYSGALALVVPMLFHPWWVVLAGGLFTLWILGIILAVVFQLAHCVEEADFTSEERLLAVVRVKSVRPARIKKIAGKTPKDTLLCLTGSSPGSIPMRRLK